MIEAATAAGIKTMSELVLLSKYERFLKYMDPILQQIPKQKSNLRDNTEDLLLAQVDLLYSAVMSGTPSRINAADSGLAAIRFRLRYLSSVKFTRTVITKTEGVEKKQRRKSYLMSRNSAATAEVILAETGCIIGSMKKGKQ